MLAKLNIDRFLQLILLVVIAAIVWPQLGASGSASNGACILWCRPPLSGSFR